MKNKAILLLNMGGPLCLADVQPFLFRLFKDPHIVKAPFFIRYPLAFCLSLWRAKSATKIYAALGGGSPLLSETEIFVKQLKKHLGADYQCFIGMSYAQPLIKEAVAEIKKAKPEEICIVSLYPHYSTTTSLSVLSQAQKEIKGQIGDVKISQIKSFHLMDGYVCALANQLSKALSKAKKKGEPKVLFSAHGLPEKIIQAGDPYPEQCEQTVQALMNKLGLKDIEALLCYQSRLGPVKWRGPFLDDEIEKASKERKAVIVVPLSFVCENSETLYELDIAYKHKAIDAGAVYWARTTVPAKEDVFIADLATNIKVNTV